MLPAMPYLNPSKQTAELLRRETSIAHNTAHGERVHRIVPRNGHDPSSVGHDDVLALPGDPEAGPFECPDSPKGSDPRYLRHPLCRDFHFPQVLFTGDFLGDFEVFPNRILDVGQSFLFRCALRPAPREARAGNAVAFLGRDQSHRVLHTSHFNILVSGPANHVRQVRSDARWQSSGRACMAMQEVAGGMPAHRTRWSGDQRIGRKNRPPGIVVLELNTSLGLAIP